MAGAKWTTEEFEQAKAMLCSGVLMGDIAERTGRTFNSVAYKLRPYAQELERVRVEGLYAQPDPTTFAETIKRFPRLMAAAQWMGVTKKAAGSMAARDWVPRRYWPQLLDGLSQECGVELSTATLDEWAIERGRWSRPAPKPQDWSDLPKHERAIARIIAAKIRDRALADEAAGYAVLEMMEYAKPHLGYGVRCAFNYVKERHNATLRTRCLTDDELQAAIDLRMFTPPNQEHHMELQEVLRAAKLLPAPYDFVFRGILSGYSDQLIADHLRLSASTVSGLKTHCRRLLREYVELDDAA